VTSKKKWLRTTIQSWLLFIGKFESLTHHVQDT